MFNRSDMMTRKHINSKNKASKGSKEAKKKDISTIIINAILIFTLALLAFAAFTAIKNKDAPEKSYILGFKPIYIQTGSMEPTLRTDSIAIVKKTSFEDCKVNDIVVFMKDDKLITHRVTQVEKDYLKTKGDNNRVYDNFSVYPDEVQAKVILPMNWVATFINDIKTVKGIIKWFVFPIFVIAVIVITIKVIKKVLAGEGTFKDIKEIKEIRAGDSSVETALSDDKNETADEDDISEDDFFGIEDEDEDETSLMTETVLNSTPISKPVKKKNPNAAYTNNVQVEFKSKNEIDDWRLN